ncbi:Cupredoxin-like domain protein [Candidatus Bilamarchaeum dharawalense]|uniref:Cupredoxin-like domain protein n=1 Tax=Candidatus Bilamarchaeum dharawalense TaxID=2885759 RepID=A0A5E4LL28_9ARCH|nr:Cupredoxin-like domain protein [Candidatus Bilamarchaeum dharawalense]
MSDIVIQKTTAFLFVGLILAILVGGYVVFGTASAPNKSQIGVANNQVPQNSSEGQLQANGSQPANVQEIYIKALPNGSYDKEEVTVNAGVPVRIHFTTQGNVGCGSMLVLYGLNQKTYSKNGQEGIIEFTPTTPGTYEYSCGMRMWGPGKLIVQ